MVTQQKTAYIVNLQQTASTLYTKIANTVTAHQTANIEALQQTTFTVTIHRLVIQ